MKTGREMPEHLASVDRGNPIEAMAQSKSDAYRASDFFLACAKGIRPDIFIDFPEKQVCIEFRYTDKDVPSEIAGYVLQKLNTYMNQIQNYSGQGLLDF